ncbi:hypothetical protein BS78_05G260900 [Paspalum vaginatum]|nr:hypothetical protein BS78_05G260900 [Paspalum vaginatum]
MSEILPMAIRAVTRVIKWWNRVVVGCSVGGHVGLVLLAGIRRRESRSFGMGLLWLAYQAVDQSAPFFLSNLSLGGNTLLEQQLFVLWVPSVVAHLAGPDNITAFSLEDNKLSLRIYFGTILQIAKIVWLMYTQFKIVISRGALFWASLVMIVVGICKYVEKVRALWKADFGNIGDSSSKKKQPQRLQFLQGLAHRRVVLGNEQALLLAHQLLDITKAAFADKFYLGKEEVEQLKKDTTLKEVFHVNSENTGWRNMFKVVEMELSLMYDILYTKAAVTHNWYGFVVRAVSPVVTATVLVLFWLTGSKDGERTVDVIITYVLLSTTLLLDVRWLLGAAASTWTYTFFNSIPSLRHEVCCSGRWRRFRRLVESLDPWQLLPCPRMHGAAYRLWSGTMGQYNLFHECTQLDQGGTTGSIWTCLVKKLKCLWTWLAKKVKFEDALMERRYCSRLKLYESSNNDVKKLLFEQIQKAFKMDMPIPPPPKKEEEKEEPKEKPAPPPPPPAEAHKRRRELDEELDFLPEFQELILIWHFATDIFLHNARPQSPSRRSDDGHDESDDRDRHRMRYVKDLIKAYVKAIRAVSDYMAFLAAVRPDMLPGLKLSSLHQATLETLKCFWKKAGRDRERLICMLKEMEGKTTYRYKGKIRKRSALYDQSIVLSDGVKFANLLSEKAKRRIEGKEWEKELEAAALPEGSNSRKRFEFLIPDFELPYVARRRLELPPTTPTRPPRSPADDQDLIIMLELLQLLLKSWVRLLIYVSIRCGRDSHEKQLGRGCELTTIVWILSEHAGIFAPEPRDGR